jgi:hypothetical protein
MLINGDTTNKYSRLYAYSGRQSNGAQIDAGGQVWGDHIILNTAGGSQQSSYSVTTGYLANIGSRRTIITDMTFTSTSLAMYNYSLKCFWQNTSDDVSVLNIFATNSNLDGVILIYGRPE